MLFSINCLPVLPCFFGTPRKTDGCFLLAPLPSTNTKSSPIQVSAHSAPLTTTSAQSFDHVRSFEVRSSPTRICKYPQAPKASERSQRTRRVASSGRFARSPKNKRCFSEEEPPEPLPKAKQKPNSSIFQSKPKLIHSAESSSASEMMLSRLPRLDSSKLG